MSNEAGSRLCALWAKSIPNHVPNPAILTWANWNRLA